MIGGIKAWLQSPYRWVVATALLGLLASGWTYQASQRHEAARLQAHFDHIANDRVLRLQNEIDQTLTALITVGGFFDVSETVSRAQFRMMVTPVLRRHPDITAINWIPRVRADERGKYEKQLHAAGYASGIFELAPSTLQPRPAAARAVFPGALQ